MEFAIAVLSEPAPILIGRLSQTRYGYILNCNRIFLINQGGQSDRPQKANRSARLYPRLPGLNFSPFSSQGPSSISLL